ncbi:MAG: DinB family protein [Candidatus Heimdallarchaeota archaeon]|nr:DinB family protein [Candidatus Heimdallarchaeota archaeon]
MVTKKLKNYEELTPRVSYYYSMLQEVRERLLSIIDVLAEETLDFTPDERNFETIGTLLFHIAAIEWSWVFEDIDGLEMDYENFKHAFALRPDVDIPQLKGKKKQFYLNQMKEVREEVFQRLTKFSDEDLDNIVETKAYKFSIEWILFHILEHETMHIGQILLLKRLYEKQSFNRAS